MDNVQNAVNQLSSRTTHCMQTQKGIQSAANLSRLYRKFTPAKVHSNLSSSDPLGISYKTQVAYVIGSEYSVLFVVRCTVSLYIVMEMARNL